MYPDLENCIIAIIGLGYVGLPLAVEFSIKQKSKKHSYLLDRKVIGYDINNQRIQQLEQGLDLTGEVSKEKIKSAENLLLTCDSKSLSKADVFIITVPTPIDSNNMPNLKYLEEASNLVGEVIFERSNFKDTIPTVIYTKVLYSLEQQKKFVSL